MYLHSNYITMARKPTEFPAQWVQKSEFKWTKDMTQKDRWICKTFIDGILSDVEKRDRAIMDLWEELTKAKIDMREKLSDLRDRKEYEIWMLKKQIEENARLYAKAKWMNSLYLMRAIICSLLVIIMCMFYFC